MMRLAVMLTALAIMIIPTSSYSHGGGLNAEGCHNDRKRGDYHCHRGGGKVSKSPNRILQAYAPPSPTYQKDTIKQVQLLLTELGYKPGKIDGLPGLATKNAITNFHSDYSGYFDVDDYESVLKALKLAKSKIEKPQIPKAITSKSTSQAPNTLLSAPSPEKEDNFGAWFMGIIALVIAYWLGTKNKGK